MSNSANNPIAGREASRSRRSGDEALRGERAGRAEPDRRGRRVERGVSKKSGK